MPPHSPIPALLPDRDTGDRRGADPRDEALRRYAAFFERLTPAELPALRGFCAADVRFRDPFNDLRGVEAMIAVFAQGFADTTEMRFEVLDVARNGGRGFILWRMVMRPKRFGGREPWIVEGVSEVQLDAEGRVTAHLDHWDAGSQFYARLPVLGFLIRLVRRRLQHHGA